MLRHWDLDRDPFAEGVSAYVPIAGHVEAVERLADAVSTGHRRVDLVAPAGLGKSLALGRALAKLRGPHLRVSRVLRPIDGPSMLAALAAGLGLSGTCGHTRAERWRTLVDACRLCRAQGIGVLLAIDDAEGLDAEGRRDLDRLSHLDAAPGTTVVRVGRRPSDAPSTITLPRLTRSEADDYLDAKLRAAGRSSRAFTPRAVARLHAAAVGVPRALDRLASRSLCEGRDRGVDVIGPELVDALG